MLDRLRLPGRLAAALVAAALVLVPAPSYAAKKSGPTVAERLARTAADIDALLAALVAAFPNAATKADQADQQAQLAESYLSTARKGIGDVGPTLDPKFDTLPRKAASNPLGDAAQLVDGMSSDAENAPNEPWALQVISIQQDLHTAQGLIEGGKLLPDLPAASPSPGAHAGHGER